MASINTFHNHPVNGSQWLYLTCYYIISSYIFRAKMKIIKYYNNLQHFKPVFGQKMASTVNFSLHLRLATVNFLVKKQVYTSQS